MPNKVYKADRRMLSALLRVPYQTINKRVAAGLADAGFADLRPAHFSVFQHLPRAGARVTMLAEQAQMTKQSMSYLIEDLEAHGYVERVPDSTDGRARIVRLTERGWAVDQTARSLIGTIEQEWNERLGHNRIDDLRATLQELIRVLEA